MPSPSARPRYATLAALVLLVACDGRFSFDENPPQVKVPPSQLADAATTIEASPPDATLPPDAPPPPDAAAPDLALDTPAAPPDAPAPDLAPPRDASADATTDGGPGPVACGSGAAGCSCSGTQCSCGRLQSCQWGGMGCDRAGGSCTLLCHNENRCTGQCQEGCRLECYGNSYCEVVMGRNGSAEIEGSGGVATLTVGPGSQVKCENRATCSITCTGSCQLECEESAKCNLKCAGDAVARQADNGGRCN
jgi:hypothetical protein